MATAAHADAGTVEALRRAAIRASFAPSVHNTQPWRFVLHPDRLDVLTDDSRRLRVLDASSRLLTISVGAALFNARVSLTASGIPHTVDRWPDAHRTDLAAVLRPGLPRGDRLGEDPIAALDHLVTVRQVNRRRFADEPIPDDLLARLEAAACAEGAVLHTVRTEDDRIALASLARHADDIENLNPAYRAELRAWTGRVGTGDGISALAVPRVDGTAGDDVPLRDFDTRGDGYLPPGTRSTRNQTLVLVCTRGDGRLDWLRAGAALERVWLEIARHGFVASPLTQVVEVASARSQLRVELRLAEYPHVLLRIGRAPLTPGSGRRRLVDVLHEELG